MSITINLASFTSDPSASLSLMIIGAGLVTWGVLEAVAAIARIVRAR